LFDLADFRFRHDLINPDIKISFLDSEYALGVSLPILGFRNGGERLNQIVFVIRRGLDRELDPNIAPAVTFVSGHI